MTESNIRTIQQILSADKDLTDKVIALCTYKEYPSNAIISPPSYIDKKAIFLTEGVLKYMYPSNAGNEIVFHIHQAPAFLTYSSVGFYLNGTSVSSCVAITPIKGYEVNSDQFRLLMKQHTILYQLAFSKILLLYRGLESKEISIIQHSSTERYDNFLNDFSDVIHLIPLKDIASYLNIQPGSLSRIRKNLNS